MEDHEQNIWIGTEDGLNHLDTKTNKISQIKYSIEKENGLQSKAVLDIFEDHKKRIWVGTWAGGIHLLYEKTKNIAESKFVHFKPKEIDETSLNVWKIFQDKANRIWIGTHGRGLF
jgi:ligand-binding sensor domain-containing protein